MPRSYCTVDVDPDPTEPQQGEDRYVSAQIIGSATPAAIDVDALAAFVRRGDSDRVSNLPPQRNVSCRSLSVPCL